MIQHFPSQLQGDPKVLILIQLQIDSSQHQVSLEGI